MKGAKVMTVLSMAALALALCAPAGVVAHDCKVVCDASDKTRVCGSDGKTYSSKCFFEFAKCDTPSLTLAHEKECKGYKEKEVLHIKISKTTKQNENEKADDKEDDSESESEDDDECDKPCSRELEQLCASDGKTYNNQCLFEIALCRDASLTVVDADGACPEPVVAADTCDKGCTREYDPLCGSDGKTYNNKCLFEIAHCRNHSLKIVDADGPC